MSISGCVVLVGALDGQQIIRGDISGPKDQAEALGELLAEQLLAQGGGCHFTCGV